MHLKKSVKPYKRLTANKKVHDKWKKYIKKMRKKLSGNYLRKSKARRRYHTRIRKSDYPRRLRKGFLRTLKNRKKWYKRVKGDIPSGPQNRYKSYSPKSYESNKGSQYPSNGSRKSYRRKSNKRRDRRLENYSRDRSSPYSKYGSKKTYRRKESPYPKTQGPQKYGPRRSFSKRPRKILHKRPFKKHRRPNKKRRTYKKTSIIPFSKRLTYRKKSPLKFVRNKLISGDQIYSNQYLMSSNRKYMARLEKDGRLAVYKLSGRSNKLKWSTKTSGKGVEPYRLRLKSNGNLIIFDSRNYKIWSSNTNRAKSIHTYSLIMKNNGNLVLMVKDKQVWSTNTWEQ